MDASMSFKTLIANSPKDEPGALPAEAAPQWRRPTGWPIATAVNMDLPEWEGS